MTHVHAIHDVVGGASDPRPPVRSRRRRIAGTASIVAVLLLLVRPGPAAGAGDEASPGARSAPDPPRELATGGEPGRVWVYFTDKGFVTDAARHAALRRLPHTYDPRAVDRRRQRRTAPGLFDGRDLPVHEPYVEAVRAAGGRPHVISRWLNAVSVRVDPVAVDRIAGLPFVHRVEPVRRGRRIDPPPGRRLPPPPGDGFYGLAAAQLEQINLVALHDEGATGQGIVVGVLDTGFRRDHVAFNHPQHPLQVVAEYDFVDDDPETGPEPGDPPNQHRHGTLILGTLAAYVPGELVGAAYDASFILCKTEDITDEYPAEEDNYVAGLEFIEMNGGDVATSSLGYIDWYTQAQLNGLTAVTTIAVNVATANGIFCCTAAGNGGHDQDPTTSHLLAPSDAFQVIACGAVNSEGEEVGFSSDGPTADGRVKPEVLARGRSTSTVDPDATTGYVEANGTSLSTPLVAGAVTCIVQAQPGWTVDQLRTFLFETASDFVLNGEPDPLFVRGYGILDAFAAVALDCNGNGVPDPLDISSGTSTDVNGNGVPDECECLADCAEPFDGVVNVLDLLAVLTEWGGSGTPRDVNYDGTIDVLDLLEVLSAWGPCE